MSVKWNGIEPLVVLESPHLSPTRKLFTHSLHQLLTDLLTHSLVLTDTGWPLVRYLRHTNIWSLRGVKRVWLFKCTGSLIFLKTVSTKHSTCNMLWQFQKLSEEHKKLVTNSTKYYPQEKGLVINQTCLSYRSVQLHETIQSWIICRVWIWWWWS